LNLQLLVTHSICRVFKFENEVDDSAAEYINANFINVKCFIMIALDRAKCISQIYCNLRTSLNHSLKFLKNGMMRKLRFDSNALLIDRGRKSIFLNFYII